MENGATSKGRPLHDLKSEDTALSLKADVNKKKQHDKDIWL